MNKKKEVKKEVKKESKRGLFRKKVVEPKKEEKAIKF